MAETTQEKKTFKWGDNEYLLDDLLKLHAEQEQNYYNFARDRGQYDDTALAGLRAAISSRISAVKNGQAFSADGILDTDKVDNTSIQTQKKGLFKKEKYVDQDNTEWAKYYLNKLVGQLKPHQKEAAKEAGGWDISKHGLSAYLTGQGLNAQDIFEKYDGRDANNPNAARSFTQRDAKLREHLGGYKTWLEGKGFDFTKNDNEWDDNFMTTLSNLINNQDWSDRTALSASLRKLGAGDGYTTAFTSDRWDLNKSDADMAAEANRTETERKAKEEREKYAQFARDQYSAFKGLSDNNLGGTTYFTSAGDGLFDMSDSEYEKWLNTHTNDPDSYMRKLQENYYKNPFDTKVAGEYLPLAGRFGALKEVTIDGKTWHYDPRTIDRNNNRLVVFDKETGETKHAFLGDIADEWNAIRRKWRIDNGYEDEAERYTRYNEQGGVLSMQTGGGFNLAQAVNRDLEERNKARAAETGNTEEVQKARDRVVSNGDQSFRSEKDSIGQPEAGFTGAEIARLASIGADITSLFLDPITGVAVGLGSTLTNFGADIADDGFQWQDVKNLGINVGFDLLGAIPIFGDALGTGAKITKNLVKWAPRIMAGMAAFQGVQNFDGMMGSWGKLTSGDKEQKLTVQDWRNIAQSISLVTGGVRAAKNKATQNKMKQQAKVDDVVGVNVRDRATGEIRQVIVDGDVAKNIRAAKGDRAKIEAELSKLDDFNGKFGESGTMDVATQRGGLQNPWQKVEGADGSTHREYQGFTKDGRAQVSDVYDFSRVPAGYGAGRGWKIPGVSDKLNQWHQDLMTRANNKLNPTTVDQRGKLTNEAFEAEQTRLLNDQGVEAQVGKVKAAVEARHKSLAKTDEFISKAQSDLEAQQRLAGGDDLVARQADAEARLRGLSSNDAINDAHNAIAHHTATIARNKAKRAALSESRSKQLAAMEEGLNAKITSKKQELDVMLARQKYLKKRLADGKPHPKLEAELVKLQGINGKSGKIKQARKDLRTLEKNIPTQIADIRARIQSQYQKAYTQLGASTKSAKGAIATAQPIAAQRKAYSEAYAQQQAAISGQALQQRLNTLQGRKAAHDPATAHTRAYTELETMLNNLRTSNPTIGGKTVNWDMDAILQRYGVNASDVFKQGGSINRNKINKFLNYAKG